MLHQGAVLEFVPARALQTDGSKSLTRLGILRYSSYPMISESTLKFRQGTVNLMQSLKTTKVCVN